MSTTVVDAAELARNRFVEGELEAGIVFAANAIEYWHINPNRAVTFRADAQDCYETAVNIICQTGSMQVWPVEVGTMLDELRRRLDLLRGMKVVFSAAA